VGGFPDLDSVSPLNKWIKRGKAVNSLQRNCKAEARGEKDSFQTLTVAIRAAPEAGPGEEKEATPA
jgi:hypothetical protein